MHTTENCQSYTLENNLVHTTENCQSHTLENNTLETLLGNKTPPKSK